MGLATIPRGKLATSLTCEVPQRQLLPFLQACGNNVKIVWVVQDLYHLFIFVYNMQYGLMELFGYYFLCFGVTQKPSRHVPPNISRVWASNPGIAPKKTIVNGTNNHWSAIPVFRLHP